MNERKWTEQEECFLSENYHKMTAREIGEELSRTPGSVRSKARFMEISSVDQQILRNFHKTETPNFDSNFSYFVSGFIAGEGCFSYNEEKRNHYFGVSAHKRDSDIIEEIHKFFNCIGSIFTQSRSKNSSEMKRMGVRGVGDIAAVVIPFFERYPMRNTHKQNQYEEWRDYLYKTYNIEPLVNQKI